MLCVSELPETSFTRSISNPEAVMLCVSELPETSFTRSISNPEAVMLCVSELPETSFTRSISNPEAVMRRRRQQKLEKKLHQFRSRDGGPDTGGTLKVRDYPQADG